MKPNISVILPVYNAAATLGASIASVQAQSRPDWEIVLINDGSTDESAALMAQLAATDPRLRCLETNGQQGAGVARNVGIAAARGRYIAFLDADDLWHPQKLEIQLTAMAAAQLPFSCTAYLRRDAISGRETAVGVPLQASRSDLLKTNTIACSTAIYDKNHFGARSMPTRRRRQDFAFWLELLHDTPAVLGVPQVLMTYRVHPGSLSGSKARAAADTWHMYRGLNLSMAQTVWYFGHYALRGLTRRHLPGLARRLGWLGKIRP